MLFEAPECIRRIREIELIYKMTDEIGSEIDKSIASLENNIYIDTATKEKIANFEKILKIQPSDIDTLADRRFRVKTKIYQYPPYTVRTLRKRLNSLCGENGYELTVDIEKQTVKCLVELKRKAMFVDVRDLLENIVPLNMLLDLKLRYNQYGGTLPQYTYAMLGKYTHKQVREEALELDARDRKV